MNRGYLLIIVSCAHYADLTCLQLYIIVELFRKVSFVSFLFQQEQIVQRSIALGAR